ncbi:MAG: caspase family protein, partial [Gammaproteobacteria bacterium]|nr:caspase family protein [Gammaproteobacteria bacterium]
RRPAKLSAADCESQGGEYVAYDKANHATALKVWLPAAQEGDVTAQTYVGEIYEKGYGIQPDYKTAAQWYEKAAMQGDARAKLNLGYLYERGLGVDKDVAKALMLYRSASSLGDTEVDFVATVDAQNSQLSATELRQLTNNLKNEQASVAKLHDSLQENQAKLAAKEEMLAATQRQLVRARTEIDKSSAELAKSQDSSVVTAKFSETEEKLKTQEQEIHLLKASLSTAQQQLETKKQATQLALAKPSIRLLQPLLVSVRGGPEVYVPQHTRFADIKGKVFAPAGIKYVTINGTRATVDSKAYFHSKVAISKKRTPVEISAVDQLDQKSSMSFDYLIDELKQAQTKPVDDSNTVLATAAKDYSNYYALVIGNDKYREFSTLKTAVNDAKAVGDILSNQYGFKTTTLVNASRFMILATLKRLSSRLTDKDNLLVYYAGHGQIDDSQEGYWLPVDANKNDKRRWISNSAITEMLSSLSVKRVLVVADSCYSGTLTLTSIPSANEGLSAKDRLTLMRTLAKSKSRIALTSGGLRPVSDEGPKQNSVFAHAFLESLEENTKIIAGQTLYRDIQLRMETLGEAKSLGQEPRYAPIRHAGHQSGEFFFFPRKASAPS